ncbi:MAG: hypothetical protein JXR91_13750 [Deltaproteobacteria bacterium]|nr:hypothetical protein [Deltaproteobacteria bacterium]
MNNSISPLIILTIITAAAGLLPFLISEKSRLYRSVSPVVIFISSIISLIYLLFIWPDIVSNGSPVILGWQMPFAKLIFSIDALSGFILIPLYILTAASSVYGWKYFDSHKIEKSHWFFFSLLTSGMFFVLVSQNAIAFIISWEIMSVSSFFLVITDKEKKESMRAGLIYLITAHVGLAFMFITFFMLAKTAGGSFDFSSWKNLDISSFKAGLIFITALISFGTKAGFVPFHVWLPLAHPAAPSHVSALMSGIMIKMGIYGILRVLTFITPFQTWWGILLIVLGAISGVLGILFANGQHDLKKMLGYSSVENIGIILLGIGVGIVGVTIDSQTLIFFGFAGALLHVFNHAMFKGLLFMGAGAVIRQTGTGDIDRLGGLAGKMPLTSILFITGSIAITGLPFFNGFISEFMIYFSSMYGAIKSDSIMIIFSSLFAGAALALIGGLAVANFTKVSGTVFLGEPRVQQSSSVKDVPFAMILGMGILAAVCIIIGMGSYFIIPQYLYNPVLEMTTGINVNGSADLMTQMIMIITIILSAILLLIGISLLLYKFFTKTDDENVEVGTWDCGYSNPLPSMQYTSSSFASPAIKYVSFLMGFKIDKKSDSRIFPASGWSFKSTVNDWILTRIYEPFTAYTARVLRTPRFLQNGKTGAYVLYIAVTIISLIIWMFGFGS